MSPQNKTHAELADKFNHDVERVNWHDQTLWFVREKRDKAAHKIAEWEQLREAASQIKNNVLSNLHDYLVEFEQNAVRNGIHVHWASNAQEHNEIVHSIIKKHNVAHLVKSKSMLTEECGLNEYLHQQGVEVVDTDLGERIIQLANEPPSHIVMPCIHWKRKKLENCFINILVHLKAMLIHSFSPQQREHICASIF